MLISLNNLFFRLSKILHNNFQQIISLLGWKKSFKKMKSTKGIKIEKKYLKIMVKGNLRLWDKILLKRQDHFEDIDY